MAAVHQVVDAVLLRRDRVVLRFRDDLERRDVDLEAAGRAGVGARRCRRPRWRFPAPGGRPVLNISSPTACFDITHWMKPLPSRSVRKWIFPLERRLCSQPRSRTGCPDVRRDVFDVDDLIHTANCKTLLIRHQLRRSARAPPAPCCSTVGRGARCWRAPSGTCRRSRSSASSSAPMSQLIRPSNGTRCSSFFPSLSCTCVVIRCSATVSIASATSPIRKAWPKSRQMPASGASRSLLDHRDERRGVRQRVRDHLQRHPDAERLGEPADLLDAAERGGAVVLAALHGRRPEMDDEDVRRNLPRDVQRDVRLAHGRLPLRDVADRVRDGRRPT